MIIPATVILALLLSLLVFSEVSSFAAAPITAFEFASNGVCVSPPLFSDGRQKFTMRNVPGEGDCMFMAVALAAATSMGIGGNNVLLRAISIETRKVVAQIMNSTGNLHIEENRIVPCKDLLRSAAKKEGLAPNEYLHLLQKEGRNGGIQGGGPELVVLSNVLRRPISIYELEKPSLSSLVVTDDFASSDEVCPLQCMGIFGGGVFEDPCLQIPNSAVLSGVQPGAYSWHLHILVLDVASGQKHACVLLPLSPTV
jgi:hypothetical protein